MTLQCSANSPVLSTITVSAPAQSPDGCKFLADETGSYWLMDAIASYLPQFTGCEEFISAKLTVTRGSAELVLDNGNGKVLDRQHIPFTDFPLPTITLYACWGGDFWVLLLPSEY